MGPFPGGGHGNPFHYSCLENPMDREAWWATVHRVTKSQTQLKWLSMHSYSREGLCQHKPPTGLCTQSTDLGVVLAVNWNPSFHQMPNEQDFKHWLLLGALGHYKSKPKPLVLRQRWRFWGPKECLRLCDPFLPGQQKVWASFCLQMYLLKIPTWAMERKYCSIWPYHTF